MLQKELVTELTCILLDRYMTEYYWTDSTVVLGCINNDLKRFKVFVANRVQLIRDHTDVKQWHYVNTANNPSSRIRGLDLSQKEKVQKWFQGPQFHWNNEGTWCMYNTDLVVNKDDPEVKR